MRKIAFLLFAAFLAACGGEAASVPPAAAVSPDTTGPCALEFRRFNGKPTSGVISRRLDLSDDPGIQFLMGVEAVGSDSGDLQVWLRFRDGSAQAKKGPSGLYWGTVRIPEGYSHVLVEAYEAGGRCEGTSFIYGVR